MDNKFVENAMVMRGLAIFGVVFEHTIGWGYTALFWWTDRYRPVSVPNFDQIGSVPYYIYRASEVFWVFCLPIFFIFSGYFMQLTSQREKSLWKKIFARIKRLAIPFIIWSIAMILVDIVQGRGYSVLTAIFAIISGRSAPAFYFVPVLIELYLLSPFIINQMQKRFRWVLISTAIIQLFSMSLAYGLILNLNTPVIKNIMFLNEGVFFTNHIFWFTLGIAIGFYPEKFDGLLKRVKWWLPGLSVASYFLAYFEFDILWKMTGEVWIARRIMPGAAIYSLFIILTLLAFKDIKLPFAKLIAYLGSRSYGIYLVHSLVLIIVSKIIYHIAPILLSSQFLYQLILLTFGIGIPLIMMGIAARFASGKFYAYFFGRM